MLDCSFYQMLTNCSLISIPNLLLNYSLLQVIIETRGNNLISRQEVIINFQKTFLVTTSVLSKHKQAKNSEFSM